MDRPKKRLGSSSPPESDASSGEPTSTAREARPSARAPLAAVLADRLGHNGIILLLFETPSGFAIFRYYGVQLFLPNAKEFIWLKKFRTFNDKSKVINHTGISTHLTEMIKKWHLPGQKLAVGKLEYKKAIEARLKIPCLFNDEVLEVMWGLKNLMRSLVPEETSELTGEDRLQMSYGMKTVLDRYGFHDFPNA
ncbi:probable nucleolar protein 5-2 isoform X2 [Panicum virgatum]|uniref:probable nucleolar protein 5-2 isoform X2 n=1 Tax=Panicum virgatum TaxID=38727 RepID=UPI0019D581FD|nr:probable nucleolar protein 5-2 isoform X2 [Panicum virgatum]